MRQSGRLFILGLVAALLAKFALYYAWAATEPGGVFTTLCRFDCVWYLDIAKHLYSPVPLAHPDQATWAFFPLFPLLIRVLSGLTRLPTFPSAIAVSVASFVAAAIVSVRYRAATRPGRSRLRWAGTLLVYPYSLYFALPYTESLYLLLATLMLAAHQARRPIGTGIATGLLTATRPTGVLAVPFLAVDHLWRHRALFRRGVPLADRADLLGRIVLPIALMPLGLALFMLYLYAVTGDALAFSHVQVSWSRSYGNPVTRLYWAIRLHGSPTADVSGMTLQAYGAVLALMVSAWQCSRGLWLEGYFLAVTMIVAAAAGTDSLLRFAMLNPVMLLAAGDVADRIGPRWLRWLTAAGSVAAQALLFRLWTADSILVM